MKNLLSKSMKAAVLALVFGAVTVLAAPFQGPTQTPAVNNAPLPINVSMNDQFKQGGIGISSLLIGPGTATPGATNASILGSVRIGSGAVTSGSGYLQVNDRIAVGSSGTPLTPISPASVPQYGIVAGGIVTGLKGFWTPSNSYVGMAALTTPPTSTLTAPGNTGSVVADRFCFSGTNGACTTTWGGSGFPPGSTNQTVRYSAANTPVAAANLLNDGTNVTLNGVGSAFIINGGTTATPVLLYLGSAATASKVQVNVNKQDLQFWNAVGNRGATIYAYDLVASQLANASGQHVCADSMGKLILCGPGGPTGGTPAIDLQVNGQDNYTTTIPDSFTISDAPNLTWSVTSLGAGWTCTGSNGWSGTKSANGGSQSIAINSYGTETFVITCVNGTQTVSDTATYTAGGYYTYWANASYNAAAQVSYTSFRQSDHASLNGLTITATTVGSSGGGFTAYLKPGYPASCTTPINSTTLETSYANGENGDSSSRVIIAPAPSAPISGSAGNGAQYISGSLITPSSSSGVPTNIPRSGINPGAIYTDSSGVVRGRGGEGTVTDSNGNTVNCTGNNLNGIPGGTGRGTLGAASTTYWMSVGTADTSTNGTDGAIRISW